MLRTLLLVGCVVLIASAGPMTADRSPKKKSIKAIMMDTHRGNGSPLNRASVEIRKKNANWDELVKDAKAITQMADVLSQRYKKDTFTKEYIASAIQFSKAVQRRDRRASRKALLRMENSCCDCHGYGNVIYPEALPDKFDH